METKTKEFACAQLSPMMSGGDLAGKMATLLNDFTDQGYSIVRIDVVQLEDGNPVYLIIAERQTDEFQEENA